MNVADQRVLKSTPATLSVQFVDQDGAAAEPAGAVTVGITQADGTVLLAPLTATNAGVGVGVHEVDLTATETATLEHLTCTWTAASDEVVVTHVDVVGAYGFTLYDMAQLDGMAALLPQRQRDLRQAVEELVERRTGWLWTPRLVVETFDARQYDGYFGVSMPADYLSFPPVRLLRSVKVDGVVQTLGVTGWRLGEWGQISAYQWYSDLTSTAQVVEVIYEAGEDRPPVSLTQALLDAVRQTQLDRTSGASSRALSLTNEFGNINYARATAENLFGNPAVDAVLALWDQRMPSIH